MKNKVDEYMREYRKNHSEQIKKQNEKYRINHKEQIKLRHERWRKNNLSKLRKWSIEYRKAHQQEIKNYYLKNKELILSKHAKYMNNRIKTDINFRILCSLRHRLNMTVKHNHKFSTTIKLLGCNVKKLRKHLTKQFQSGMSWKNYGKWHIDHIRPCTSFDLSKPSQQRKCFHYTNLQPLWAKDNLSKSDNLINVRKEQ